MKKFVSGFVLAAVLFTAIPSKADFMIQSGMAFSQVIEQLKQINRTLIKIERNMPG